ncbi:MAG: S41 family peptidase [Bacteroidota bacterium]
MTRNILIVILVCLGCIQQTGAQNTVATYTLTSKTRLEVVNVIRQLLMDHYVFPDTARIMSAYLNQRLKAGAYNNSKDPVVFSDALTRDLFSVYHDGHLLVQYNPAFALQLSNPTVPTNNTNELERNRELNYGFRSVEILNGNIGYINLERFWADPVYGKETAKAALKFVANTHAIIIDLRTNGGGSPETVAMLCGFFLKTQTHINSSYNRSENTTTEFWATPDSTLKELTNKPVYILTSQRTFSAAEEFAYDLQSLKRATIIGETTGGGAHNTFERDATNGFVISIPYGRAVNAVTKTNWEGVGVKPDIEVTAEKALEMAEIKIFEAMIAGAKSAEELYQLNWQLDLLKAINNPIVIDTTTLKKYAGVFGDRTFTYTNGKLYYQRTGRQKFELEPMTPTIMKGKNNTYFKIEFVTDAQGNVNEVKAYYEDVRVERAKRTN